ncbi:MAG: hypothetical protein H5T97_10635 [Firmicutes bacterium]|nr:hypothetical protein [Bacillota bacterium]
MYWRTVFLVIVVCVLTLTPCMWASEFLVSLSVTRVQYVFSSGTPDAWGSERDRRAVERGVYVRDSYDLGLYRRDYTGMAGRAPRSAAGPKDRPQGVPSVPE